MLPSPAMSEWPSTQHGHCITRGALKNILIPKTNSVKNLWWFKYTASIGNYRLNKRDCPHTEMLTVNVGYYKESLASRPSQGTIHRAGKVTALWSSAIVSGESCQGTKPVQRTCSASRGRKKYINAYTATSILKYIPKWVITKRLCLNNLCKCPFKGNNEKCPKSFPGSV